jgi:hypothetical protein
VSDAISPGAISTRAVFIEPATWCVLSAQPPKKMHFSQQRWHAVVHVADNRAYRCANATLQNIFR